MAAQRPRRRADRLGGPDARRRSPTPRSPGSRRWSGSTRRRGALILYAAVRQLAAPRDRADVGDGGAVGRRRSATSPPAAPASSLAFTAGARDRAPALAALIAGLLRLGFLANFISEPVLKGFIVGLALTIIIGQVPKLLRHRRRRRRLLREGLGTSSATSATPAASRSSSARCSLALVLALKRDRTRRCPASLVAVGVGIAAVAHLRPRRPRRRDRRPHRQRPAVARRSRTLGLDDYASLAAARHRGDAGRLRRGPRRGEDLRRARPLRDRPEPGAARPRRRQPRLRPVRRHGRQRQPLEDRGERRRRRPHPALRPARRRRSRW